jgi:hypothetical protein
MYIECKFSELLLNDYWPCVHFSWPILHIFQYYCIRVKSNGKSHRTRRLNPLFPNKLFSSVPILVMSYNVYNLKHYNDVIIWFSVLTLKRTLLYCHWKLQIYVSFALFSLPASMHIGLFLYKLPCLKLITDIIPKSAMWITHYSTKVHWNH